IGVGTCLSMFQALDQVLDAGELCTSLLPGALGVLVDTCGIRIHDKNGGGYALHTHPPRLRLRSSNRPFELFCGLVHAKCRCVQAVAITLQRFLLRKADDLCLVAFLQERSQLSLKITYVGHRCVLLIRYITALDLTHRGASLCLWPTRRCQGGREAVAERYLQESHVRGAV